MSSNLTRQLREMLAPMAAFELADSNTVRDLGGVWFRSRVEAAAKIAVEDLPGDIIEIGVYNGGTAVYLARVARDAGRRYLGIDNFLPHPDYHHDLMEPIAREAVAQFMGAEIVKIDAHSPEGIALVKSRAWCFALSDDGHEYEHHKCELDALLAVMPVGIICVDDVYVPGVEKAAFDAMMGHPNWSAVSFKGLREMYLVGEPS